MLLVLHRCIGAMWRAISRSILLQNSFIPMSSKRVGKLRSCKQDHVTILQIYSQNLCRPPASINTFMELAWGGLEICRVQGETYPESHSSWLWSWRSQVCPDPSINCCTHFPLMSFFPLGCLMQCFSQGNKCNISNSCDVLFSRTLLFHWFFWGGGWGWGGWVNEAYMCTCHIIGQRGVLWIKFNVWPIYEVEERNRRAINGRDRRAVNVVFTPPFLFPL
jgi:hypothetical protein